ncbi:MAG: ABC transporter permease [Rubricoccaceae bacterium]
MIRHHLRTALRALRRDRSYALLNGVGLAISFTCCILIGLFARAELSFDRFHADADQLAVIGREQQFGQELSTSQVVAYPLHVAIKEDITAADQAILLSQGARSQPVANGEGQAFGDVELMTASAGFFEVFTFPLIAGDPKTALAAPNSIVLAESMAQRVFGAADAVGQTIRVGEGETATELTVTGVTSDPPRTSTIQFEAVQSVLTLPESRRGDSRWGMRNWMTVARLAPGVTVADLDAQLTRVTEIHHAESEAPPRYFGVALPDYYMSDLRGASGFRGDRAYLGLFGAAALLVLLLGGINYVNLATARALRRAKEVGVRKSLGARRVGVAAQFLTESVVLTVLAAAVAFILAATLLGWFNTGFTTDLELADLNIPFVLGVFGVALFVGLLAGAYPALVLSGFAPARVLRGALAASGKPGGVGLRRVLVVAQFVVAIGLLAGTAAVLRQIAFTSETDLGFVKDGLVWLPITEGQSFGGEREVTPWRAALDVAQAVPGVSSAAAADVTPGNMPFGYADSVDPFRPDEQFSFNAGTAETGYIDVLGSELVAGADLHPQRPSVLINEAMADVFEWTPREAVGKPFVMGGEEATITGVIENYHFESMRNAIAPVVLMTGEGRASVERQYQGIVVRLMPGQVKPALDQLEAEWAQLVPDVEFAPEFVDESLAALYDADRRLSGVLAAFALVAVLIACLGLIGLAAYTAERRTKEIGVRRVLGASIRQIVALLTREYAVLVMVGAAIAIPLAVLFVRRWLEGFAYRADLSPTVFATVVLAALVVALVAVGGQALRAARRDPVAALRAD